MTQRDNRNANSSILAAKSRQAWRNALGNGLFRFNQYRKTNDVSNLHQAIQYFRVAAQLSTQGVVNAGWSFHRLGDALKTLCDTLGNQVDKDGAILAYRIALEWRPSGNPFRAMSLWVLASTLVLRFERTEDGGSGSQ